MSVKRANVGEKIKPEVYTWTARKPSQEKKKKKKKEKKKP